MYKFGAKRSILLVLLAAATSFVALATTFGYTMWVHYRALDWPYAGFAATRIAGISLAVGGAAYFVGPRRSLLSALAFGRWSGWPLA